MRFLLDNHIWLWSFREPHKLSSEIHKAITDPEAVRFISPVSIWEVMILLEKKRLKLSAAFRERQKSINGFVAAFVGNRLGLHGRER